MPLAKGEFSVSYGDDQIEVWVTQMGPWANMNTAFIDRIHGIVAIVDPFDGKEVKVAFKSVEYSASNGALKMVLIEDVD